MNALRRIAGVLAFALLPALAALADADTVTLASPDAVLSVKVGVDNDGRPYYAVSRRGRTVIAPSRLGFILADQPKLERNFALAGTQTRSSDQTWEQPWGERRYVRDRYNELRVRLAETKGLERALDLLFRVYDDGVGFRYEFPSLGTVRISEELTEFAVADPATAAKTLGISIPPTLLARADEVVE